MMIIKGIIGHIKCGGCVDTVMNVLLQIPGVKNPTVDLTSKEVTFESEDPQMVDIVKEELAKANYPIVYSL